MKIAKRALVSTFVLLGAVFLVMVATVQIPAGPPAPAASGNGDTNGDGVIDVSDAVHLLLYLFRNGEPPAAVAQTSPAVEDAVISIDERLGQLVNAVNDLVDVQAEALETPCLDRLDRFVDNGNQTVTDTCTGLMWQAATFGNDLLADLDGDGRSYDDDDRMTYDEAVAFVEGVDSGGHTDWRLPTIRELEDLMLSNDGSINIIKGVVEPWHFTSTPYPPRPTASWGVYLFERENEKDGARRAGLNVGTPGMVIAVRDTN